MPIVSREVANLEVWVIDIWESQHSDIKDGLTMFLGLDPEVEEIGDRGATLGDNVRHNFHIDLG